MKCIVCIYILSNDNNSIEGRARAIITANEAVTITAGKAVCQLHIRSVNGCFAGIHS